MKYTILLTVAALGASALIGSSQTVDRDRTPRDGERPARRNLPPDEDRGRPNSPQKYSIEQAVSDKAQLHTVAFSGLAFITGDFGASTFMPPGKVCDFFGFQYLRDIDAAQKGHNPAGGRATWKIVRPA